ncbi:hypothetical protein [Citreimonas sp.]|uniref:hypothetical protein n=1 Tax=Citreimonas sp. TaxID=3036715 RepID=UPI00405900B7
MTTPKRAYTRADMQRWKADLLLKRPVSQHTGGLVQGIQVVSLAVRPSANGAQLLIVNAHGEEAIMLLNPVLAAALSEGITKCGIEAGWMDEDGGAVTPTD